MMVMMGQKTEEEEIMMVLGLDFSLQIQRFRAGKDLGRSPGPSSSYERHKDHKREDFTLFKLGKLRLRRKTFT